jgi:hypothetical protein
MNQRRRLKRVTVAFLTHLLTSESPKLFVSQRQQLRRRTRIA